MMPWPLHRAHSRSKRSSVACGLFSAEVAHVQLGHTVVKPCHNRLSMLELRGSRSDTADIRLPPANHAARRRSNMDSRL